MKWTDPRFVFGIILLIVLALIIRGIGLNDIKPEAMSTLHSLTGLIGAVFGAWANWAFGKAREEGPK